MGAKREREREGERGNAISKFVSQPKNYNELKARKNVSTLAVFDFFRVAFLFSRPDGKVFLCSFSYAWPSTRII
jgi:hypothetical protein